MYRFKVVSLFVVSLLLSVWASHAYSQLTEFAWNGASGAQNWQQNGNWDMANFPNDPQHVADLSVNLSGNLTLNLGSAGSDVTVAGLNIGGTGVGVTTDITSSGALLRFQNDFVQALANADFNNNSIVEGRDFLIWQRNFGATNQLNNANGDANLDTVVNGLDLVIWQDNFGNDSLGLNGGQPIVTTRGGVGTINRISANVRLVNENLEVKGLAGLVINGNLSFEDDTPVEGEIGASFSNTSPGITTTLNGMINLTNQFDGLRGDFGLNTSDLSQGTLIVNGIIDDGANDSDLFIGVATNNAIRPLHTVRLNAANTYSGGTKIRRVNLELANDASLGTGTITQAGPANQFGYNLIALGGDRTLDNDFSVAQWQTFKGSNSFILSGDITQTNNRGFVNQLDAGETLTLTGRLDIWEDDEALEREFEFDGTGTTVFNGVIRDDPFLSGQDRRINKSGTGVLIIDVGPGDNQHTGPTTIAMGNFHYANNDSLNTGAGLILSRGGAIGVDTGVANNATFAGKIDPNSTGGIMLAPSDAAANLNFTTTLANAGKMTVAAPETGLTYTGTITPANSTYGLGGGTGTLTLPNAQLTDANAVQVRNGGTVELLGNNTYTGPTTVITKFTSSHQEQAEADSSNINFATGLFFDRLVAPTLVVDDLANGGVASSIGSASSDAANLFIQGSTLKYVGTGDSTNRLFTIGTGGARIDSSGSGAVVFSNTGFLGRDDAESRLGTLDDFSGQPNEITAVMDTSDIIVGMPVSDPSPGGVFTQAPCNPDGSNCIPAGTVVTGISEDGRTIGLSNSFPFIFKPNTNIVFGTVPRTLTLDGTNANDNTLASVVSDSAAGGIVNVTKSGSGKWNLTGANTYTGDTTVEAGILSMNNAFLADSSAVRINGGVLDLGFSGSDIIGSLFFNGTAQSNGTWGRLGHPTATFKSAFFTGNGLLNVGGVPLGTLAAVPEPSALILATMAALSFAGFRRRSHLAM